MVVGGDLLAKGMSEQMGGRLKMMWPSKGYRVMMVRSDHYVERREGSCSEGGSFPCPLWRRAAWNLTCLGIWMKLECTATYQADQDKIFRYSKQMSVFLRRPFGERRSEESLHSALNKRSVPSAQPLSPKVSAKEQPVPVSGIRLCTSPIFKSLRCQHFVTVIFLP